ncbi:hypothetical protein EV175_000735 [Coemansia sp. RSA 1933]|nr:hypothetical protein EV175_000735 [Coemansia sp. RSA 1933]
MSCNSSYSIKTDDDRVVLTIEQHSIDGKSTDSIQQQEAELLCQNSSVCNNVHQHPWDAILKQTTSSSCPTHKTPQDTASDSEYSSGRHTVSQRTATDTATEPTPTTGGSYDVPTDVSMVDSIVDEIATQGLFDGLDELYDFGDDSRPEKRLQLECSSAKMDRSSPKWNTVEKTGNHSTSTPAGRPTSSTNPEAKHESNRTLIPDTGISKQTSLGKESVLNDRLSALDKESLADMSDEAANKIIETMGGFSVARTEAVIPSKGTASGSKIGEMADMSDTEAQSILGDLGGFAKPRIASTKGNNTSTISKNVSVKRPSNKAIIPQMLPSPSTLSASNVADWVSGGVDESLVQKMPTPFPSKKDVLSARRALRMDGGKAAAAPFNTPARLAGLGQATRGGPKPQNQLKFKSPSLKRPAGRSQFNSPSKRLLISKDTACNDEDNTPGALRKSPARLLQFSKPFRSPARICNPGSSTLPLTPGVSLQQRLPPRIPPVDRKEPTKKDKSMSICTVRGLTAHTSDRMQQSVAELGCLVDVGSRDGMPKEIFSITSDTAENYAFPLGLAGQFWGVSEARQTLIARGCIPSVITDDWVRNHYRWSVWSAASYARRIPTKWKEFWSVEALLNRILHRYEREYTRGGRSALKMVFEGDASAKQLMVLCVASIRVNGTSFSVKVTDGWYGINSSIDPILEQAIRNGRLREGDKIACTGLRIEGLSEGMPPLSAKAEDVLLCLTGNSVRRARWHTKLGFKHMSTMFMSLSGVYELGGPIGATLDVVIVRSYPMLYMEMATGGQNIIRTEKEELKVAHAFEEKKTSLIQSFLGQLQQKEDQERRDASAASGVRIGSVELDANCMDGETLYNRIINTNVESIDAQNMLSDDQREVLERYVMLKQDEHQIAVKEAVEKTLPPRQVHALFKLLVCDYPAHKYKSVETNASKTALVTVWRPQNMTTSDFKEGSRFLMSALTVSVPTGKRRCLQDMADLKTQRQTEGHIKLNFNPATSRLKPMDADPSLLFQSEYCERSVLRIDELRHLDTSQEVDVAGNVERCGLCEPGHATSVCLSGSDEHGNMYHASIEFSNATFGSIRFDLGKSVVIRNCWFVSRYPGPDSCDSFILRAEPYTEITSACFAGQ